MEITDIRFYRRSIRFWLVLAAGIVCPPFGLVLFWFPALFSKLAHVSSTGDNADTVLIRCMTGKWSEHPIKTLENGIRFFVFRQLRYVLFGDRFELLEAKLKGLTLIQFHEKLSGLSTKEANMFMDMHGPNDIDIEPISLFKIAARKLFHPFYVFQIASILVWFNNGYQIYAAVVATLSFASFSYELYSAKANEKRFRDMVRYEHTCQVYRDREFKFVDTKQLVIGDVVLLEKGLVLPCDMVLLQGECIVDESTLTGESVPIVKVPIPCLDQKNTLYDPEKFKLNTLFSGSKITNIRHSRNNLGIVLSTGFSSTKGELFRSILFPTSLKFKFNSESHLFLFMMAIVATGAFLFKLITGYRNGLSMYNNIYNSLDLITITVPPALPLVLSIGVGFSMSRLRSSRIFCINPERINFAGWVNVVCWDKTGTLTDDQLDWQGIIYSKNQRFEAPELETSHLPEVQTALVTCHGMNYVNGQAVGHFVDTEMLRATRWQMKQPSVEINAGNGDLHVVAAFYPPPSRQCKDELYVIKRFAFDAHICRSSVVVLSKSADGPYQMTGSAKGSPEAIRQICRPDTIPYNFSDVYGKYAAQGFYILALAVKDRVTEFMEETPCAEEIRKLTRKTWETNMKFVGFMLFRSPIKPEAFSTIKTLRKADIKSVIITGDNALNSIHVARDLCLVSRCVIINNSETTKRITFTEIPLLPEKWAPDPLERDLSDLPAFIKSYGDTKIDIAINSGALHNILEQYEGPFCQWLIRNTAIFARMKPKDKTLVIENLIEQGYYTAMTGDGTNDCGALKAAHFGMALSDTEASIVAPFCSANKSIADIPKVIAEGRCALETSFTAFKYMAVYPVVQLIISACAYYHRSQVGNAAYIIDDLGIVLGLATFMTYTAPAKKLSLERPAHSLFSSSVMSSLLGQVFIGIFFFVFNLRMLRSQPWFCPSEIAQSGVDPITFTPSDILAPLKKTFPCYYIDPERDVFQEALVSTYETTFAWTFGHFQLIIAALAFSLCSTFRLPLWTNKLLVLWLVFSFSFSSFLLLYGPSMGDYELMRKWFQFRDDGQIPQEYRIMTFMLVLMNLLVSLIWESVIVNYFFKNMGKSGVCCWNSFNDKESVHGDFETIPEAAEIGPKVLINPHPKGKS